MTEAYSIFEPCAPRVAKARKTGRYTASKPVSPDGGPVAQPAAAPGLDYQPGDDIGWGVSRRLGHQGADIAKQRPWFRLGPIALPGFQINRFCDPPGLEAVNLG